MNKETQRYNVIKTNSAELSTDKTIVYSHLGVKSSDIHKCTMHNVNCSPEQLVEINSLINLLNEFKSDGSKFIDIFDNETDLEICGYSIKPETEVERELRIKKELARLDITKAMIDKGKLYSAKKLLEENGYKIIKEEKNG